MSEPEKISIPAAAGSAGGFRELLELNLGRRVTAEFLVGLDETVVKTGTLYAVENDYFVLNDDYGNYVAADLYSLKFLTFCPNCVPAGGGGDVQPAVQPAADQEKAGESAAATPVSPSARVQNPTAMAALNYAKRKARRLD